MAGKQLPPVDRLKQLLSYDPETGVLTWRERLPSEIRVKKRSAEWVAKIWNSSRAGKPALDVQHSHGYRYGTLDGVMIYAHRAAIAMAVGEWPNGQVDHINGNRSDNRLSNLRVVDQSANNKNSAIQRNNTSGFVGVSYNAEKNRWWAYIHDKPGSRRFLGAFKEKGDAINARKAAEVKFGYHENHGRDRIYDKH